jgi:hypothetical protein
MVVGLYLSLERLNFLLATLVAWTITFVLPSALALALNRIAGLGITISIAVVGLIQVGLAAAAWARLKCSVRERTFLKPND